MHSFFETYTIKKEKVFMSVAKASNLRNYADTRRRGILEQLALCGEFEDRLVTSAQLARVHVIPMADLQPRSL